MSDSQRGGNPPQDDYDADAVVRDISARTGGGVEQSDIDTLRGKKPEDRASHQKALEQQYAQRAGNTPGGGGSPVMSNGKIGPPVQYNPGAAPSGYKAQPTAYTNIKTPEAYQGAQISQFQAPNHQNANQLQTSLIEQILANPQTLDAAAIAKLRESQKDTSLALAQQQREGMAGNFADRRVRGGQRVEFDRMVNDALSQNLMKGYRDIDIAALATNRQDELNALQSSEQTLGGQTDRANAIYDAILRGEMSQESIDLQAVQSALEMAGFDLSKVQLSQDDLYREAQLALQKYQAEEEARYRQAALSQGEWGSLLDEAFRRDEFNANDRYRYASL